MIRGAFYSSIAVWCVTGGGVMAPQAVHGSELDRQRRTLSRELHGASEAGVSLARPRQSTNAGVIAGGGVTGSDTCASAVVTPLPVGPVGAPGTIILNGDNSAVTDNDCSAISNTWWESFQITECATVTLEFCGTTPPRSPDFTIFVRDCDCGDLALAVSANRADCGDNNLTARFEGLPPGTYYYPIFSSGASAVGAYTLSLSAEASSLCVGACCDQTTATCTDDVDVTDCSGPNQTHLNQGTCCEMECAQGGATFASSGVSLLSHVALSDFSTGPLEGNEVWGYVSPSGREYALVGLECAVGFVEVTDPVNPVIVAEIPGPCSIWRDMAIFQQRAYNVIDSTGNGLQIIDLTNIDSGVVTLTATTTPGGLAQAHNIAINEDTGFAYAVSTNINSGMVVLDLSTPTNPPVAGQWTGASVHDVLVVSYTSGPFAGREIAFASSTSSGLKIVDVTDKSNMFTRSTVLYPNTSIAHQAWLSEDRRYLFLGDEGDETGGGVETTTTYVFDVQDLDAAFLVTTFTNEQCAIDHNMMVRGSRLFQANYTTGLRVFDVSNVNAVTEIGFFDTHPENNATTFDGAWGVYSALPSGIVLVSDIQRGLFVLDAGGTDPGACCDGITGICTDNIQADQCAGATQVWTGNEVCANVDCTNGDVPAVSEWGVLAFTLALLTLGTLLLRRRTAVSR